MKPWRAFYPRPPPVINAVIGQYRKDGHESDRPLLLLFNDSGRLHVFVGAEGKDVKTPLESGGAQHGEDLVLVGKLAVVAAMIRQQHVDNGAGDKDEDRRQQDRQPESGERDHVQPP
jgi:hypothetical protein